MKSTVFNFDGSVWKGIDEKVFSELKADLVICFGSKSILAEPNFFENIRSQFNCSEIAIASTSGEIINSNVQSNSAVAVALEFEKTNIKTASINISDCKNSKEAGTKLLSQLPQDDLCYVLILSDGSLVNGSDLVDGVNESLKGKILITGGLAGDGAEFVSTLTGLNNKPEKGLIVAIGFYGKNLIVKNGSEAGWEIFGVEKSITKSEANKLYELNNQNCLDMYKRYLGDSASKLPAAALNFPLSVLIPGNAKTVVRTILSVSEEEKSMTFAGNMPEGSIVRFMKTNFNSLMSSAAIAADKAIENNKKAPDFALLVSCVGRKIVLGTRIQEEVDAVSQTFKENTPMLGFYANGEIAPLANEKETALHNQTMTITTFYEI